MLNRRNGYEYEAQEVMDCLCSGKLESPLMPLDESLSIMQTLDAIRAQCGLKYPMEWSVAVGITASGAQPIFPVDEIDSFKQRGA